VRTYTLLLSLGIACSVHSFFKFWIILLQGNWCADSCMPLDGRGNELNMAPERLVRELWPKVH